jgi:N-methylhydantoinase B
MRAGIAAIPDGTYTFSDLYDDLEIPGEMPVSCEIRIAGDEMWLDFESPDQVRAGINMVYTALLSTVYYAVKTVVDPTILPNAGLARPLHISARAGSIFHCVHPAAVNGRIGPCQRVVDLIHGALAKIVPERVIAACNGSVTVASFIGNQKDTGATWIYLETIGGGFGARADRDGLDGVHVHMTNTSNLPVEALEIEYPLTVMRYELVDGSGGAGRQRGGMGLRRIYRAEADTRLRVGGARTLSAPWGLQGGMPGGKGDFIYGEGVTPYQHGSGELKEGQVVTIITPGAGGYGPPSERTPEAVRRDIAERRITEDQARAVYPQLG